jgi:hypothetical protein
MAASPCPHCGAPIGHIWVEGQCLNVPAHDHHRASVGFLCQPCVDRINDRLEAILILYATLPFVTAIGSVPDDIAPHRHVKGDAAPAPMRLAVIALLDGRNPATGRYTTDVPDVAGVLHGWAECLADHYGLVSARVRRGTLLDSVRFLTAYTSKAAAAPWVDDYQAEIDWCWNALRQAHGLCPPQVRPVGRCPSQDGRGAICGGDLWPDKAGTMQVACGRCLRVFGPTYLRHLGGMIGDTA